MCNIKIFLVLLIAPFYWYSSIICAENNIDINDKLKKTLKQCQKKEHLCSNGELAFDYGIALVVKNIDREKGFRILRKSSEDGNINVTFVLAQEYLNDRFPTKNTELANFYARKAIEYIEALDKKEWRRTYYSNLANFYVFGIGTTKNEKKAFEYALEGARLGDYSAKYLLMHFYKEGKGTPKNIKKARELYRELKGTGYIN